MSGVGSCRNQNPPARLIVRPGWDDRDKAIGFSEIECSLSVAHDTGRGEPKDRVELVLTLDADRPAHLSRFHDRHAVADLDRSLEAAFTFLHDPAELFRRVRSHCGICGRKLTDETSRARGVGPECIRKPRFCVAILQKCKDGMSGNGPLA
jgi:hypothetical protein